MEAAVLAAVVDDPMMGLAERLLCSGSELPPGDCASEEAMLWDGGAAEDAGRSKTVWGALVGARWSLTSARVGTAGADDE